MKSDIVKGKVYPNPTGKMGFHLNMLYDQDINCKKLTYEVVASTEIASGMKRKRAEAIVISDDENEKECKENDAKEGLNDKKET